MKGGPKEVNPFLAGKDIKHNDQEFNMDGQDEQDVGSGFNPDYPACAVFIKEHYGSSQCLSM